MTLKKYLIAIVFLILNATFSFGQFYPSFKNLSISDYKGGNKNWDISIDSIGRVYVANGKGLLEYNGQRWRLWKLPNKAIIRSVLVQKDRIYTGSFEEFGYWKRDGKGSLNYTSITKQNKKIRFDQEYWQILNFKGQLFFRSFTRFYRVEKDMIEEIPIPGSITSCNVVGSDLLIYSSTLGLLRLSDKQFEKVPNFITPELSKINSINQFNGNKLLVSTASKGCFIFDGINVVPWKSEINTVIQKHELNNVIQLDSGKYVFGTIDNGIYITDVFGSIIYHINKEGGLINNTVLNQKIDDKNQLWLALDNGISIINLNSKTTFFNDNKGNLGAVYDIEYYNGTYYLGSNTGLYYLDEKYNLNFIKGSSGQVLELKRIGNYLFCGHNKGTFIVDNKKIEKISEYAGGWNLNPIVSEKNLVLQGTYSGIIKFENKNNDWTTNRLINFNQPVKYIVFEDTHTAWVAHPYKGLHRITFDKKYTRITSSKAYDKKGLSSPFKVKLLKIKNDIVFKTDNSWQRYEPLQDSIVSHNLLSSKIGSNSEIISENIEQEVGVKSNNDIFILPSLSSNSMFHIPTKLYEKRLVDASEKIIKINDSINALCLIDGFMLYDVHSVETKTKLEKPIIDNIKVNGELVNINTEIHKTKFLNNKISIQFSSPSSRNHSFEFKLNPIHSSWQKNGTGEIQFLNLLEDDYEIAIRTSNASGEKSEELILKYVVLPPWYRGAMGLILYIVIALATLLIFYVYNKRKLNLKKRIFQVQLEKKQKILLKEKELENIKTLNQVKNKALENDVELKSKQLANTAMALLKKNEILVLLKKEFLLNKDKFSNMYSFNRLIKQIDKSIEHEDEWNLFEYNFNQVHKAFFERLKKDYPQLTHKDLKLCAYIKMNLSTKEISPLLNISVRGVETHRYRLKKKFLINDSQNITSFLIKYN